MGYRVIMAIARDCLLQTGWQEEGPDDVIFDSDTHVAVT